MDLITTLGAAAGFGAFVGVSLLAILFFSQARDVRRLRDWAGRAPERAAAAEEALAAYEMQDSGVMQAPTGEAHEPVAAPTMVQGSAGGAPPVAPPTRATEDWQIEAEAAAAAELDQRRLERERQIYDTSSRRGASESTSPLWLIAGGLILLVAVVFGAFQLLGGDGGTEPAQEPGRSKKEASTSPGKVRVAVLNGTAVPGLAAKVGDDVRNGGFKLGAVTNSESSFETTLVMYRRGNQPEAEDVAAELGIQDIGLMTPEIQDVSKGAQVAVVVGQDRAPQTTSPATPGTTTPGVPSTTPTPTPVP